MVAVTEVATHKGNNGSNHGDGAADVTSRGDCPDCGADNLDPVTGQYGSDSTNTGGCDK